MPDGNPVETITFSLDGKDVTALPGETIWQVAKREGTTNPAPVLRRRAGLPRRRQLPRVHGGD